MTDKMTVKACKTSKQIMVQLLQTGTDEKPSSKKPYPRYYSYFTIRLMTKTMFNLELRGQGTPPGA
jgi:hypothetical protein